MANAIYKATRDGLADFVSKQAADRVLEDAVASVGSAPEIVDATTMSRLLRGRVRREMERTLPRAAVRRKLADLDARLARQRTEAKRPERGSSDGGAREASPTTAPQPVVPGRRAVTWRFEPADVASEADRRRAFPVAGDPQLTPTSAPAPDPNGVGAPTSDGGSRTASPRVQPAPNEPVPGRAGVAQVAPPVPGSRPRTVTPHVRPDRWIERIAERDAVRQWVWCPPGGPAEGRGMGPDPERVAAALIPLVSVLERHGPLRSLHVRHGRGHVLVGRDRGASLTVAGDDALNLGSIYATFRALEEEP